MLHEEEIPNLNKHYHKNVANYLEWSKNIKII